MQHIIFSLVSAFIGINLLLAASLQEKISANSFPVGNNQLQPYTETHTALPTPPSPFIFNAYAKSPKIVLEPTDTPSKETKKEPDEVLITESVSPTVSISPSVTPSLSPTLVPSVTGSITPTPELTPTPQQLSQKRIPSRLLVVYN